MAGRRGRRSRSVLALAPVRPGGPRVAASTWNRELALVNGFFAWAAGQQLMPANPVPQRARRAAADRHRHGDGRALVPAAQARDTGRDEVKWLTPAQYRQWRDTGLRGYRADGLPDEGFCGRWASRNALFADVMVRTGLRLAEQASLTVGEVPAGVGHRLATLSWGKPCVRVAAGWPLGRHSRPPRLHTPTLAQHRRVGQRPAPVPRRAKAEGSGPHRRSLRAGA